MDGLDGMDGIMDGGEGRGLNSPRVGMKLPGQLKTGEKKHKTNLFLQLGDDEESECKEKKRCKDQRPNLIMMIIFATRMVVTTVFMVVMILLKHDSNDDGKNQASTPDRQKDG